MRTSTSANGRRSSPACPAGGRGRADPPQYGPNVSVIPKIRPAARRTACRGGSTAVRLPGFRRDSRRSRSRGVPAMRGGLVGPAAEQRHPLALEQAQRARRFGLGAR